MSARKKPRTRTSKPKRTLIHREAFLAEIQTLAEDAIKALKKKRFKGVLGSICMYTSPQSPESRLALDSWRDEETQNIDWGSMDYVDIAEITHESMRSRTFDISAEGPPFRVWEEEIGDYKEYIKLEDVPIGMRNRIEFIRLQAAGKRIPKRLQFSFTPTAEEAKFHAEWENRIWKELRPLLLEARRVLARAFSKYTDPHTVVFTSEGPGWSDEPNFVCELVTKRNAK